MRVSLIEDDNGRLLFRYPLVYVLKPDPERENQYTAAIEISSERTGLFDLSFRGIKKLTDTVYRDNTGIYLLTEEHPFFNAPHLKKIIYKHKLNTIHINQPLKMALYAASREYNKRQFESDPRNH